MAQATNKKNSEQPDTQSNSNNNNVIITKYHKSPSKKDKHLSPSQSTNTGDPSNKHNGEISADSSERKVPKDVRIAVIGNVDSGKSTMIGVLTSGQYDDGRGSARSRILRHNHEQANGRTSCLVTYIFLTKVQFLRNFPIKLRFFATHSWIQSEEEANSSTCCNLCHSKTKNIGLVNCLFSECKYCDIY